MNCLKPFAEPLGQVTMKCPACGEICDFSVIDARLSLFVKPISLKMHGVAVCGGCETVFRVKDESAQKLRCNVGTLTPYDLNSNCEK